MGRRFVVWGMIGQISFGVVVAFVWGSTLRQCVCLFRVRWKFERFFVCVPDAVLECTAEAKRVRDEHYRRAR